jgi:hypothetical protein
MMMEYSKILSDFEYDSENGYWVRTSDGKAFNIIEKDEHDMAKVSEVIFED